MKMREITRRITLCKGHVPLRKLAKSQGSALAAAMDGAHSEEAFNRMRRT
jgi:hypothetical protein